MSERAHPNLSIDDLEQAARIIIPMVRQAVKPEFDEVRRDVAASVVALTSTTDVRINALERHTDQRMDKQDAVLAEQSKTLEIQDERLSSLEQLKVKALAIWSIIAFLIAIVVNAVAKWLFERVFKP